MAPRVWSRATAGQKWWAARQTKRGKRGNMPLGTEFHFPFSVPVVGPVIGPGPSRAWALVVGALEYVGQNPTVSPLTPPFHLWDGIREVASAVVSRSATNHGHPLTYPRTSQLGWKIIGVPIGYIWQGRVLGGE